MIGGDEIIMGRCASDLLEELPDRVSHKIAQWIEKTPQAIAIHETLRTWSYGQLGDAIAAAKKHLQSYQVRAGDRIMLIAENCCALIAYVLAASDLNVWVAIINARLSAAEIDAMLLDCEPRQVIYTIECSNDAKQHAKRLGATFQQHPLLGNIAFSGTLNSTTETVYHSAADQVFTMIYTSGTTGKPKGVMLTHRNIAFIASLSGALRGLTCDDRVYAVLPISHVFGLASTCMGTLFAGGSLFLAPRFDAQRALVTLVEQRITILQGVPPMFSALIEHLKTKAIHPEDLHLRYMSCGGAVLDPETKKTTEDYLGLTLNNGYGMTESSPTISQTRIQEPLQSCTTGRPIPGVEVRLMNNKGTAVTNKEVGELWVRGPNIMKGYFRKPAQTAQIIDVDGWLNTQDLAQIDTAGNITIIGRTKELIVRSGFNVYPAEVEAVLNAHPAITHSAVIGKKSQGDESILAFVQPTANAQLSTEQLQQYCRQKLSAYKCPASFTIMAKLPTTASGKILKSRLKERVCEH